MGLEVDWFNKLILVTSPTTSVDGQVLHDFIEDQMATPRGMTEDDILSPEGKIEDPTNPGVFSQIIIILSSLWQIQFWGGSGYTRIYGAKIVGGVGDEPMKATGTANDITVLESPVDGLTVATGSGVTEQDKTDIISGVLTNNMTEDYPVDGQSAMTLSQAQYATVQLLSEFVRSGAVISVKKRDGSTEALELTLDSATAPTQSTQSG